jgi:hypothetical protein
LSKGPSKYINILTCKCGRKFAAKSLKGDLCPVCRQLRAAKYRKDNKPVIVKDTKRAYDKETVFLVRKWHYEYITERGYTAESSIKEIAGILSRNVDQIKYILKIEGIGR